jgi:hypothetical protein
MARKRTGQKISRRGKGSPQGQRGSRKLDSSVAPARSSRKRTVFTRRGEELQTYRAHRPSSLSPSQLATRAKVFAAHADMQRDRTLTAAEAARQNGVAVRDFWKYLPRAFRKDSSGKIHAIADRYTRRMEIPGPDGPIVIKIRGSKARSRFARFRDDVFRFLGGDLTALDKWKGVSIQGHELLTDPRILKILGEQGNLPEHFGSEQVIPYYGAAT